MTDRKAPQETYKQAGCSASDPSPAAPPSSQKRIEGKGRWLGRELDDWLRAESELLYPMHLELVESDSNLTVRAEVPGFSAKELEINITPRRLTVTGKRETKEETKKGKAVYSELCGNEILRVVDLPTEVDISNVSATLKDGILNIKMAKTAAPKSVRVELKAAS